MTGIFALTGLAFLGLALTTMGHEAKAEDKYFSKEAAKKIGAEIKALLPPASTGWKVSTTYSEAVVTGAKGKDRFAPAAKRNYQPLAGDGRILVMIIFVGPTYHAKQERKYQGLTKDPKKGVRVVINGAAAYLTRSSAHANAVFGHYMRVGSFVVFGDHYGKGVTYASIEKMLRSIDANRLQAISNRLRK